MRWEGWGSGVLQAEQEPQEKTWCRRIGLGEPEEPEEEEEDEEPWRIEEINSGDPTEDHFQNDPKTGNWIQIFCWKEILII